MRHKRQKPFLPGKEQQKKEHTNVPHMQTDDIETTVPPPHPFTQSDVIAFLQRLCGVRLALRRITIPSLASNPRIETCLFWEMVRFHNRCKPRYWVNVEHGPWFGCVFPYPAGSREEFEQCLQTDDDLAVIASLDKLVRLCVKSTSLCASDGTPQWLLAIRKTDTTTKRRVCHSLFRGGPPEYVGRGRRVVGSEP